MVTVRTTFVRQMNQLEHDVLRLAELVETQLTEAVKSLQNHRIEQAQRVVEFDATINRLRYEIEEQAYTLLALQQPTAGDLRRIVAAVSIATNLERMGDHAASIARLALRLDEMPVAIQLPVFDEITTMAAQNLRDAMKALETANVALARRIVFRDESVDMLHQKTYDHLIQTMISDPTTVEYATMLLQVSHHLERFADRVSNICERVSYIITGVLFTPRKDGMP